MAARRVWIFGAVGPGLMVIDCSNGIRIEGIVGLRIDFTYGDPTLACLRFGKDEELVIVEEIVIKGPSPS